MATVIDAALAARCDALARAIAMRDSGEYGSAVVDLELGAAVARVQHVVKVAEIGDEDASPALLDRAAALLADAAGTAPAAEEDATPRGGRRSRR